MRAISLHQPWATAMAIGLKTIETRHWNPSYRGPLAIHAAKRWDGETADWWRGLGRGEGFPIKPPLGVVVAVGRLVDVKPTEELLTTISDRERSWGNYGPKRFGWIFRDVQALEIPISVIGRQSFFQVPDELFPPAVLARLESGAGTGFDEDHSLGNRSWGRGRHGSIPKTHGAEGRNWVD